MTHSQIILPMAQRLLSESGLTIGGLDALVCAKGPGSYTGLRIGIAAVKGLALGAGDIKCAGISTLESLAWNVSAYRGRIVSVMNARSGIVYGGVYLSDGERVTNIFADRVCPAQELAQAAGDSAILVGDNCEAFKSEFFANNDNIKCAPFALRTQRASSLCMAFEADPTRAVSADELNAAYLQPTHADKLKDRL